MNNLAIGYYTAKKLDLALPLFEKTLKLRKTKLGPDHPDTLQSMNNLAWAYQAAGKLNLALPLFEETLTLRKAELGPDHPDTLESMDNLASAYQAAGKLDLALPLFEETLKLRKAKLGPDHPDTVGTMASLGSLLIEKRRFTEAEPLLRELPGHPRKNDARRLEDLQRQAAARIGSPGPEEICRRRTAALERLRGDEGAREVDSEIRRSRQAYSRSP